MNKNLVFISGITGFVGQNMHAFLAKNYDVKGISRQENQNNFSYSLFIENKINFDAIIHLAGKAHDLKKVPDPEEYYEANYELTKKIFDVFLFSNASVFIFMSSVKAVADEVEGVLNENFIPNPKTHYGISKLQAENYILNQKLPEGKRVYILRPCMIHGPGNKGNLNLLYLIVSKGFPWPLGSFHSKRSFLSIDNLSFVVKELLENNLIPSGIYQVSDDVPLSTNSVIQILSTSISKKSRVLNIPTLWIKLFAVLGDYLHLPLNSERLQKLTENYVVSNNKIVTAIGKSLPTQSKEGLLKTFQSFKK
jgi:nucleoside-diphosphate-sugar epimerase